MTITRPRSHDTRQKSTAGPSEALMRTRHCVPKNWRWRVHADDCLTDDLGTRHWLGYPFGVFQLRLALRVVPQLLSVTLLFCLSACA